MNTRHQITLRNRSYLHQYLNLSEEEWLDTLRKVGPPTKKYAKKWSESNPASGWCGGVTNTIRLINRIPNGYVACKNRLDPHFYFINPITLEVVDLTIYQMSSEYEHDYTDYTTKQLFMNVLPNHVEKLINFLELKVDDSLYELIKKKVTYIKNVRRN